MRPVGSILGVHEGVRTGDDFGHPIKPRRFFINDGFPRADHLHVNTFALKSRSRISQLMQLLPGHGRHIGGISIGCGHG